MPGKMPKAPPHPVKKNSGLSLRVVSFSSPELRISTLCRPTRSVTYHFF